MEIGLDGELIIKCENCGAEYRIDLDSLDEECYVGEERGMGEEVEHNFIGECQCESCGNELNYSIQIFEYPVGAINYCGKDSARCEILVSPEPAVKYYDCDFDFYEEEEIRQEVNRACLNIDRVLENKNVMYQLTPREFEELVAEIFSQQGYNVKITPATRDGGYDMIATREDIKGIPYAILIECKRYTPGHKVGVQLVRSLRGVQSDQGANKAILITTSLFTKDARDYAARHKYLISLMDVNDLLNMMKNIAD